MYPTPRADAPRTPGKARTGLAPFPLVAQRFHALPPIRHVPPRTTPHQPPPPGRSLIGPGGRRGVDWCVSGGAVRLSLSGSANGAGRRPAQTEEGPRGPRAALLMRAAEKIRRLLGPITPAPPLPAVTLPRREAPRNGQRAAPRAASRLASVEGAACSWPAGCRPTGSGHPRSTRNASIPALARGVGVGTRRAGSPAPPYPNEALKYGKRPRKLRLLPAGRGGPWPLGGRRPRPWRLEVATGWGGARVGGGSWLRVASHLHGLPIASVRTA